MQKQSDWVKVVYHDKPNVDRANQFHHVTSPYDIPHGFRVVSLDKDRVVVEFRYIDCGENRQDIHLSGDVKASIGKDTKRLLAIDFKPSDHEVTDVINRIHRIIQQLSEKQDLKPQAQWNYRAARDAIDETLPKLYARFGGILFPAVTA